MMIFLLILAVLPLGLWLVSYAKPNPNRLLHLALYFTWQVLAFLWAGITALSLPTPLRFPLALLDWIISAVSLWAAQVLYDEWRRRRKGRPSRLRGRVARLADRLVVVQENT